MIVMLETVGLPSAPVGSAKFLVEMEPWEPRQDDA